MSQEDVVWGKIKYTCRSQKFNLQHFIDSEGSQIEIILGGIQHELVLH